VLSGGFRPICPLSVEQGVIPGNALPEADMNEAAAAADASACG